MARKAKKRTFAADFETTVYRGQTRTDVWAAGLADFDDTGDNVLFFSDIHSFISYIFKSGTNTVTYFHNLKFDGSFIVDYLLNNGYSHKVEDDEHRYKNSELKNYDFTTCISDRGVWYFIRVKRGGKIHSFYDSYKLLPFGIEAMSAAFGLSMKKLDLEYEGERFPGWQLTDTEREYLRNDVLILKQSLQKMFELGHTSLTIGSCCLKEYRQNFDIMGGKFRDIFPDLSKYAIPDDLMTDTMRDCDAYVRKSYRGAWCYLKPERARQVIDGGETYDVNSLYPYVMHSMSGNRYPYGEPHYWIGNYIPDEAKSDRAYFFVRIRTRFKLKKGMLPCIQIKGNPLYPGRKWLESSEFTGGAEKLRDAITGELYEARPTLMLTMTDFYLISEHYQLYDFEILDGVYFAAMSGLFDNYINKYMKIKEEATRDGNAAMRTIAKLFSNNLYGKMAASTDSSYKVPIYNEDDNIVDYEIMQEHNKKPGYIPVGSAITSYARNYTITAAQQNIDRFIYADTDSLHLIGHRKPCGIEEHDSRYGAWKKESVWKYGYFLRPKAYIELEDWNSGSEEEKKKIRAEIRAHERSRYHYNIKCAGMPKRSKLLLEASFEGLNISTKNADEVGFIIERRDLTDFRPGLSVPGKLRSQIIPGGTLLVDCPFILREAARI